MAHPNYRDKISYSLVFLKATPATNSFAVMKGLPGVRMKNDISLKLSSLDSLIKAGQGNRALAELKALWKSRSKNFLRPYISDMTQIARRGGDYKLALQISHAVVRTDFKRNPPAPVEVAEYAVALLNLGGKDEARELLWSLPNNSFPLHALYKSFVLFNDWDYLEAQSLLEEAFVNAEPDSYYQRLIGVNWLAALTYIKRWDQAQSLAQTLIANLTTHQNWLLLANVFELQTQMEIFKGEFTKAQNLMTKAHSLISEHTGSDRYYLERWHRLLPVLQNAVQEKEFLDLKKDAYIRGDMEAAREMDFAVAVVTGNPEVILRLRTGSASFGLQKIMDIHFGKTSSTLSTEFTHEISRLETAEKTAKKIHCEGQTLFFNSGKSLDLTLKEFRAVSALLKDHYRPLSLPAIHFAISPDQYFNPFTTRNAVQQIFSKLRRKLSSVDLEIRNFQTRGWYLHAPYPLTFDNHFFAKAHPEIQHFIDQLKETFGDKPFQLRDIPALFPKRTMQRLLQKASMEGLIEIHLAGGHSSYRCKLEAIS